MPRITERRRFSFNDNLLDQTLQASIGRIFHSSDTVRLTYSIFVFRVFRLFFRSPSQNMCARRALEPLQKPINTFTFMSNKRQTSKLINFLRFVFVFAFASSHGFFGHSVDGSFVARLTFPGLPAARVTALFLSRSRL